MMAQTARLAASRAMEEVLVGAKETPGETVAQAAAQAAVAPHFLEAQLHQGKAMTEGTAKPEMATVPVVVVREPLGQMARLL